MTPAGFPHSEILGSQLGYQLPKAYRRFPRPSSAPRAKASTVCPYKLNPPTNNNNKTKMLASTMQFSTHKQQPHPTTTPTPTNPPRTTRDKPQGSGIRPSAAHHHQDTKDRKSGSA